MSNVAGVISSGTSVPSPESSVAREGGWKGGREAIVLKSCVCVGIGCIERVVR